MILVGGFLIMVCGIGLTIVANPALGVVVALLGLAAMLYGAHRKMD